MHDLSAHFDHTPGDTSLAGTAYPSGAHVYMYTLVLVDSCCSLVLCVVVCGVMYVFASFGHDRMSVRTPFIDGFLRVFRFHPPIELTATI